ncbi:MAG TPA: BrnT family toxin [Blastocatellia bacterium]|nr:BrnT family toxin [Blastocatellia bacterium]HMV83330.1 BrnT family toxin [Blastocatellia bacterium]HMX29577.1 BrnT family toxin [Blastocatellia bacterium]HMY72372.1 BrnT family toxin [Blastocatellia bacterium]HMZ16611.1 BrnT family toxin [Blastocatellia bacterium]
MRFEWAPEKAITNQDKHGVDFEEAKEAFCDPYAAIIPDEAHSWDEERMKIIGASSSRLLLVVYVEKVEDSFRIISAREANKNEKRIYQEVWL